MSPDTQKSSWMNPQFLLTLALLLVSGVSGYVTANEKIKVLRRDLTTVQGDMEKVETKAQLIEGFEGKVADLDEKMDKIFGIVVKIAEKNGIEVVGP